MKTRKSTGEVLFNWINILLFSLFALICVFPFYYLFINTISDNSLVSKGQIIFLPKGIHFDNYVEILKIKGLSNAAAISIARTVIGTLLTLVGTSFLGYALGKRELWHRKLWYRFVIVTMYFNAGIIPWYINMKMLRMTDNFLAYVVPSIVSPFSMILFKTYVESIPASLEESADLDGAGYITKFVLLIVPLSTPIIATVAVFSAVGQWNSFMDTLFLMSDSRLFSLQYMLYQYMHEANALAESLRQAMSQGGVVADVTKLLTPTSIKMTVTMAVVLPILLVYPFLQRYFVKGIMIGAVKG